MRATGFIQHQVPLLVTPAQTKVYATNMHRLKSMILFTLLPLPDQLGEMRRTFLAINLILIAWLPAVNASAQQATESRENGQSAALARAKQLDGLLSSNSAEAPARIKQALSDENWYVRGEAARALARLGDKSASPSFYHCSRTRAGLSDRPPSKQSPRSAHPRIPKRCAS